MQFLSLVHFTIQEGTDYSTRFGSTGPTEIRSLNPHFPGGILICIVDLNLLTRFWILKTPGFNTVTSD